MTFSNDASLDFAAYPSLSFELGGPDGSLRHSAYLQSELREHSGFRSVSLASARGLETASVHLDVQLSVQASIEGDLLVAIFADDEQDDVTYSAFVSYWLSARDGRMIDSGGESADGESTFNDAAESALDGVVLHYLRQYRL
ncbi:MAG: hypothetical protein ABI895_35055 [Deltaproteobacteria bacterium]